MMMKIFNSQFETSLRIIILLEVSHKPLSFDRIYALDFISVYGKIFGLSNDNLNGDNQYMFSEFASRRELVRFSIKEMVIDGLVVPSQEKTGIFYSLTANGKAYSMELESNFAYEYRGLAKQAIEKYKTVPERKIIRNINNLSTTTFREEKKL